MTLEEAIAAVPAGYNWLIRGSNDKHDQKIVFAHIYTPAFVLSSGHAGQSFKGFGPSPADALQIAIEGYRRTQT